MRGLNRCPPGRDDKMIARWLSYPVLFVFLLSLFGATNPKWVPNVAVFSSSSHSASNKAVTEGIITVDGVYSAFSLGKLYALAEHRYNCVSNPLTPGCRRLRRELSDMTGLPNVTFDDLNRLKFYDSSQSGLQRVASYVTLTNIIFLVGICLAAIAVIPLFMKFLPLFAVLFILLKPFYEIIVYGTALVVITQAQFYDVSISWLVSFTGCILAIVGFAVSTVLHVDSRGGREEDFCVILGTYLMFVFGIVALIHPVTSSFIGFFACVGLVTALGFTVIPIGLGYIIGFQSRDATQRFAVTSFLILNISIAFNIFSPPQYRFILAPFKFGLFTLCGTGYFIATLIMCSRYYYSSCYYRDNNTEFFAAQFMYLVPLVAFFSAGIVGNIPALSNAAGVFFVLYFIEKYIEFARYMQSAGWLFIFMGGCQMVFIAFYLRTHTEVLMSLVNVVQL